METLYLISFLTLLLEISLIFLMGFYAFCTNKFPKLINRFTTATTLTFLFQMLVLGCVNIISWIISLM